MLSFSTRASLEPKVFDIYGDVFDLRIFCIVPLTVLL